MFRRLLPFLALAGLASSAGAQAIPAFPGAEGYGGYAKGGRGGDVYIVTNTNASGAGSFRDAIETVPSSGRTIVFAVSGHIHINGLRLTGSKVTIAGQTAPGDGVGLVDGTFRISGDDVIVRHLRMRHRKSGSGGDCLNLDSGSINSVIDSCSLQFSTDENMSSFNSPPENVTMQWSVNAWGLESHSCGGLWDQNHATAHHTLWAHHHTRNPKARPSGLLEWVNNVTFDWDIGFIMGDSETPATWKANVRNSYFLCPPGNLRSKALEKANLDRNGVPNFSLYLNNCRHDNDGDGLLNGTDKGYGIASGNYTTLATPAANTGAIPVTMDDPVVAFKKVVSKAGALRLGVDPAKPLRDEVDARLIQNLVTQTANHITRESDLAGVSNGGIGTLNFTAAPTDADKDAMPDYYELALGWNPAAQDNNTALANSGGVITGTTFFPPNTPVGAGALEKYTRLEEYLHFLAIPHGTVAKNTSGAPTSVQIDLRKFTAGFSASPTFSVAIVSGGSIVLSGAGNAIATFTPTLNYVGRARFDFTVTDAAGHSWTQTCALVVTLTGLPRDLVWKGDATANHWDFTTAKWLRNGAATTFSAGDAVTFDDSGSKSPAIAIQGTQAVPSSVLVDASGNYTFTNSVILGSSSPSIFTKRGTGTLTVNSDVNFNVFTLEAGTLSTPGSLSVGKFELNGGTFAFSANQSGAFAVSGTAALSVSGTRESSGAWTGAGTANVSITGANTFSLRGNTSAFAGTIALGASTGFLRLYGSLGSPLATFDLGTGTVDLINRDGNASIELGALTGGAGTTLSGASATANPTTYRVGATGNSTTFAGTIANGMGGTHIEKIGTGALTLTGASTATGSTTVSGGTLIVAGSLGNTPLTVANGAMLAGGGSIGGVVTASAGAVLSPGTAPFTGATMTVGPGLALQGSTLYFDMSGSPVGTNDKIVINGGTMALTGTQYFQFLLLDGSLSAGNYGLITGAATSSASGVSLTHNLPVGSRQTFTVKRDSTATPNPKVWLEVLGDPATLTWTGTTSANWDSTTANNWTGATPNSFGANDAVIFDDSSAVNTIALPVAVVPRSTFVNNTTRNYTLAGGINNGSLTKSGPGGLTLTGANIYGGGTTINAGATIALANDSANAGALGTGPITLNGGAIAMYSNVNGFSGSTFHLVVPAGQTGMLNADARHDIYGTLSGGGTLTLRIPWIRTTLYCDWTAFTGQINVITDGNPEPSGGTPDHGELRMGTDYSFPGFPASLVNLGSKVTAVFVGNIAQGAGTTIPFGELSGTATSRLYGGPASAGSRLVTYRIGGRGTDATFAGIINEQDAAVTNTSIVKTGAGIWTLSGSSEYNGGTTVEQGTLKITGSIVSASATTVLFGATLHFAAGSLSTDALNIATGANCIGHGTVTGDVNNDGTLTVAAGGTLIVNGDVVNNGTMRFTGGSVLVADGAFVNHGTLDLLTASSALPADLENYGVIIDSTSLRVTSAAKVGNTVTLSAMTYSGHVYQLQRSDFLISPNWQSVGAAKAGNDAEQFFADATATGTQRFYRMAVTP